MVNKEKERVGKKLKGGYVKGRGCGRVESRDREEEGMCIYYRLYLNDKRCPLTIRKRPLELIKSTPC